MSSPRVAAVVLAAGASARMGGANKLLAEIDGRALVVRAADAALASRARPVVVVTGHDAERVARALADREVTLAHNPEHAEGLAGSLRVGLSGLDDAVEAALICLADMPWVGAAHLDALIAGFAARTERPICVPVHGGRRGNPVLWPSRYFDALRGLEGDVGGRLLLQHHAAEVHAVPVSDDAIERDVDTPADLPD